MSGGSKNSKIFKEDKKEYKTPQAVNDFVRTYRKRLRQQEPLLPLEELDEKIKRLEEFLLKRIKILAEKEKL